MTRRLALLGLSGACVAGYGALAARGLARAELFHPKSGPLTPISHQLGWLKGVQFGGEFIAQDKGYLRDEGIDATYTPAGPSTDYRTLVASGRMMISESGPVPMVEGAVSRQPLVAFCAVMQRDPGAIMSPPDRPITSLRDMVGRTIGIPPSVRRMLEVLARRARIDLSTVNIVPVGTDAGMLAARQIDGYYSHATTAVPSLRDLGMDPHVLFLSDLGMPGYAQSFIVRQDFLEKHHDLLVRYTRALIKGWRFMVDHPTETAELVVRKWASPGTSLKQQIAQAHMMRDFILTGDAVTKGLLWIEPGVFESALEFARESGTVPRGMKIDIDKIVTQSVIKAALGSA